MDEGNSPVRETQIRMQIQEVDKAIKMIEGTVVALEMRLKPVMRSIPETGCKAEKVPVPEMLCPLAQDIKDRSKTIRALNDRLDQVLNALEV